MSILIEIFIQETETFLRISRKEAIKWLIEQLDAKLV